MNKVDRRRILQWGGAAAGLLATGSSLGQRRLSKPDVIVVGAGASGCNVAWHLREKGLSVHVFEASGGPATQASHNAAGFVAHWSQIHVSAWGRTEWQMQRYGIDFYSRLADSVSKTGATTGFVRSGIAYVYRSPELWEKAQARIERARQLGTRLEILTASRCNAVLPQIDFRRVAGIAFDPDSVRVRASDMIPALAAQAMHRGAHFVFNAPVVELIPGGVRTMDREYFATSIIVSAGAWSRPLVEMSGTRCPAKPLAEIRYTTKPLQGMTSTMPLLIFADYGFYIREERGGLLIGGGDPDPAPSDRIIDPSHPPTVDKLNLSQAYRVRKHIESIEDLMPVLKTADIDQIAGGIPTFTDDVHFIADAVPGREGLFVLSGCQEAGITHGPALGLLMSELVTGSQSSFDRDSFRLNRFDTAGLRS